MQEQAVSRRQFIQQSTYSAALLGAVSPLIAAGADETPAALGGTPVRKDPFPSWPQVQANDEANWRAVLDAKGWCRLDGDFAKRFEQAFAEKTGAKECLAVNSGTHALFSSLNALGVGPGDEVLVPPYTFVATVNVVLLQHAIPVFVDTDRETFQIDAKKLESRITERTRAILPVHLGGNVADLDTILSVAKKHNLRVIEDACQSHLAEWRGKKVGTLGDTGCFSFQVTKNLSGGEGGALLSNNEEVMDRCYSFHSNGRERKNTYGFSYVNNGTNMRMTEFQAAILLSQLERLEEQSKRREENAAYLTQLLSEVEGVHPAKMYDGATRNAYHLYMFRYDPSAFKGLSRDKFKDAMQKEGIPCSTGYSPLNKEPFFERTLRSRAYERIYDKAIIDTVLKENECPENDQLCKEAVWFFQTMLLADRSAMDQIAAAVRKVQKHADAIAKA